MIKITSKNNKLIKSVNKLMVDKKYRHLTNLFVAESYRVIETLVKNKIKIRNLIISSDSKYFQIAKDYEKNGIDVVILPNIIYNSLTSLANSDGLIGVFNKPKDKFNISKNGKYIILDRIQNPGNLGSIIRTAVGFKMSGLIISNDSVDLYNPQIIRATMGNCFSIPIKFVTNLNDIIDQLHEQEFKVYATVVSLSAKKLNNVDFNHNSIAIVFGNEGNGLKTDILKICDEAIYIPIDSNINSLNVSVAVGIILYQLCKQYL
ncbi:MAG: RNA methyltransferase [Mycoplasmataceae bacterium]|jgi:TrmH family RNA methyltransferase|nr:RNA methyltransferase [Mycoplasmataceae bacterium]